MPITSALIRYGYIPQELPPPFGTSLYADLFDARRVTFPAIFDAVGSSAYISRTATHNLARVGTLRRQLGIPNPINFLQLAERMAVDWVDIIHHCSFGAYSLSLPVFSSSGSRAIARLFSLSEVPSRRASLRAASKFILSADISRFYPTVYTHSIPWALNTKAVAKAARRTPLLLGNELDRLIRNSQDGQTIGIPIGPDTSLVIAEILLCAVDRLVAAAGLRGFRYMDDFEFGFKSYSDAAQALSTLQAILHEFELQLNPAKTVIRELPEPIDQPGVTELRAYTFRAGRREQRYDIIYYFNRAFELAKLYPKTAILRYAIARTQSEAIHSASWDLFKHLLLQCATNEPGTLPLVIDQLKYYSDIGYPLDRALISEVLSNIIEEHAGFNHGSEVAWALWGALVLGVSIVGRAVDVLKVMSDSVVAILALDAASRGLLGGGFSSPMWESLITADELHEESWLLAYEANVHGWLPGVGGIDNVAADPAFGFLKANGVRFYDPRIVGLYRPTRNPMTLGDGQALGISG